MISLVLPEAIVAQIENATAETLETAGVLLARLVEVSESKYKLLGISMQMVPDHAYIERKSDRLAISSDGYVAALGEAEELGAVPIWFHTHPGFGAIPEPSVADRKVDKDIGDLFRMRSGSRFYGTLIASPSKAGFRFSGELHPLDGPTIEINQAVCVGETWRLIRSTRDKHAQLDPIFDRNVKAFGSAVQATLGALQVGIVGCGGTGSAVAEQLIRLGIRDLTLIDADELSLSNTTRVYGSTPAQVGRPKASILAQHMKDIAPDARCDAIVGMVTQEAVARKLSKLDVIFGCTDDNAGRLVLSRLSTYYLLPVIDVGVKLSSDAQDSLTGIDGRVTIMAPGAACLVCRGRIDLARAAVELRTPDERQKLEDEGYAPALGQIEPAVVAFTTAVAAAAVGELLERLTGFGSKPRPTEILLRFHEREISTNIVNPLKRHYCHPDSGKLGIGMTIPFLEQTWIA